MDEPCAPKAFSNLKAAILLALLVGAVYWHALPFAWHFDDKPNILENPAVHLQTLSPDAWMHVLRGGPVEGGGVSRPVARLSFAVNWLMGGSNPVGYRLVNILLHWLTAWCLYGVTYLILATPAGRQSMPIAAAPSVALLSAALWAVNPIQTQAVTYIVQRMTILATLCYLLGLVGYLVWRRQEPPHRSVPCGLLLAVSFLMGLGSKEIVITLPLAVLLVEWVCYRQGDPGWLRQRKVWAVVGLLAAVSVGLAMVLTQDGVGHFIEKWYAMRPFTLWERLLTQPRVILRYLSLVIYPLPMRLSLEHDVVVSTSWIAPWTTLPALAAVVALALGACARARVWPLAAMAVLFFLIGHAVEGSFLPLELFFEHRNYLPSAFIFLPAAAGVVRLLQTTLATRKPARGALTAALACMLMSLGLGTYIRNQAWATENRLWADAAIKAPGSARPLNSLAVSLAWSGSPSRQDLERALRLLERARRLTAVSSFQLAGYIGNMGDIQHRLGRPREAAALYAEALAVEPGFRKARFDMIGPLVAMGRWPEALQEAQHLVAENLDHPEYLKRMGSLLLWQERPDDALPYLRRAHALQPRDGSTWLLLGAALSRAGHHWNGQWFLRFAAAHGMGSPLARLSLIENRRRADDDQGAMRYSMDAIAAFAPDAIAAHLRPGPPDLRYPPLDRELIHPMIVKAQRERVNLLSGTD